MVRGAGVESAGQGRTGHVVFKSGRPEIRAGEFGFHLALHGTPDGRAQRVVMGSARPSAAGLMKQRSGSAFEWNVKRL